MASVAIFVVVVLWCRRETYSRKGLIGRVVVSQGDIRGVFLSGRVIVVSQRDPRFFLMKEAEGQPLTCS